MTDLNVKYSRELIQAFEFKKLFIEELGWSNPPTVHISLEETELKVKAIAKLGGVIVFAVIANGQLPHADIRAKVQQQIRLLYHENLLIFLDKSPEPSQAVWYWLKESKEGSQHREHSYFRGQSGDGLLSKLMHLFVDFSEFDDQGNVSILRVVEKLKKALDIEKVTKKFFTEFQQLHVDFLKFIQGVDSERDRKWYASILLNRLMFIWFLQKKNFLAQDTEYLRTQLQKSQQVAPDRFYEDFLKILFFKGFALPTPERDSATRQLLGQIPYLNGGLFLPHRIERDYPNIVIVDKAFEEIFKLFARYSWSLNDTPEKPDNEINPDVLGYIFEKYINQKQFGAYYTRPEITEYLCERTIERLIVEKMNAKQGDVTFERLDELLIRLDAKLIHLLLKEILPNLRLLDPACGSGAFLVAAMKSLINVYSAIIGKIKFLADGELQRWLAEIEKNHASVHYFIKKEIISKNLFGVDIMEEAMEIAKLRLFLALVSSAQSVEELEPLPNIDFNILAGNSLVGLLHVNIKRFEKVGCSDHLFQQSAISTYRQILDEKNRMIQNYRELSGDLPEHLQGLRDAIYARKQADYNVLNQLLLDEFQTLKIQFEQATWDVAKNKEGKPEKRPLRLADMGRLQPFHWGYEFDEVLAQGGFDAIITNPPWDVFQTDEKEFFQEFFPEIQKNKIRIEDWKKQFSDFMQDTDIQDKWLNYASRFSFVSKYFKNASQFKHQIAIVNGKNVGSKINLYSYFLEQSFNLLRSGGLCGIVVPSGIYTDLGATGLRDLLFAETEITGLFCFENRKAIFEGVDSRFKFVVLSFEKGRTTEKFPTAFMRHEVRELATFPQQGALWLSTDLIKKLSPDSRSVMEFKSALDVQIAEKMLQFPLLGEQLDGVWNLKLTQEFNMTTDSHLFKTEAGAGRLPLYEGKMIHQFTHLWGAPRYWVDEHEARKVLLGKEADTGQKLDYQGYRLGFRDVARNTDGRTMIATVLPRNIFCPHTMSLENVQSSSLDEKTRLFIAALFNSFIIDTLIRQRVTAHVSFFFVYNLPMPRLTATDAIFNEIVQRAAQLVCTSAEFDDLRAELTQSGFKNLTGVTDLEQRAQLRAELDAMIARLYGLTAAEFEHVLNTFPLVSDEVKSQCKQEFAKK